MVFNALHSFFSFGPSSLNRFARIPTDTERTGGDRWKGTIEKESVLFREKGCLSPSAGMSSLDTIPSPPGEPFDLVECRPARSDGLNDFGLRNFLTTTDNQLVLFMMNSGDLNFLLPPLIFLSYVFRYGSSRLKLLDR